MSLIRPHLIPKRCFSNVPMTSPDSGLSTCGAGVISTVRSGGIAKAGTVFQNLLIY